MAEAKKPEIEKFLLAKLETGIKRNLPYSGKFKKMKESLENQLKSATDEKEKGKIREKLFLLNNHMNEINSKFDYFSWRLFTSLNQIHKDIQSAAISGGDQRNSTAPPAERNTRTTATKEALGFDADVLAVRNLVLYQTGSRYDDFNAVGIVGAEGVGKTTLGQSIFAQDEVKERFLPRIWISLSENPTHKEESLSITIAKRILLALGVSDDIIDGIRQYAEKDFDNRRTTAATNNQTAQPSTSTQPLKKTSSMKRIASKLTRSPTTMKDQSPVTDIEEEKTEVSEAILAALIHAIRLQLKGKRYLIVLDDASEMEKWYKDLSLEVTPESKLDEKLAFAFPKGYGGTVLVIGWPENVVKAMVGEDESNIHRLLPLEDPKLCWNICEEEAEGDEGGDQTGDDKKKVEDEVVKRSNGLPVAARLMGKIIKESIMKKINNQQPAATANSSSNQVGVVV